MQNSVCDLKGYLEPQERFERLAATTSRRFGRKFLDLSYANPYDGKYEQALRALELAVRDDRDLSFQHTPYGGRTIARR